MQIYTSYYTNKKIADLNVTPVGISLDVPANLVFEVPFYIEEIAPSETMIYYSYQMYRTVYLSKLESVSVDRLKKRFQEVLNFGGGGGPAEGKDLVLLCIEDLSHMGDWCHRRIFAEWWQKKTGQVVKEL
ncbi:MAG: hypothetical protein E3K32_12800 [wastewater metagenome]|nr:hypothetical protein [Candidatus Loosdrechtia aerotolerans]